MKWKKLAPGNYESENGNFDFHIREEEYLNEYYRSRSQWIVDVFTLKIEDNNQGHIESEPFETLKDAKNWCENY